MKKPNIISRIFAWTFSVFCLLTPVAYGIKVSTVLFLLAGIASFPIKPVRELWRKLFSNKAKWIKPVLLTIIFLIAVSLVPQSDIAPLPNDSDITQSENGENTAEEPVTPDASESNAEKNEGNTSESQQTTAETESSKDTENTTPSISDTSTDLSFDLGNIPEYNGTPFYAVNGGTPYFTEEELKTKSFEIYSDLDSLGRCGVAVASVGRDIMPTEERESIGQVKPTGWHTVKYDCVDGKYLYNRCHLIGFQLTGENANEKNLITGTRYMNVDGMLPFENMVADYVKETSNHVMYRVTPVYAENELLSRGVLMEAYSVEDKGEGICFNVFVYNIQPGIVINYSDGSSYEKNTSSETKTPDTTHETTTEKAPVTEAVTTEGYENKNELTYILNTKTKKFHYRECSSVKKIADKNKQEYTGSRDELIDMGYTPCGNCDP